MGSKLIRNRIVILRFHEIFPCHMMTEKVHLFSVQVNLFQKPSFLHQLTHNMTWDCWLNSPKNTCSELFFCFCFDIQNNICTQHVLNLYFSGNSMKNLSSYCGLTDSRMRASDTDLPVCRLLYHNYSFCWLFTVPKRILMSRGKYLLPNYCSNQIHTNFGL